MSEDAGQERQVWNLDYPTISGTKEPRRSWFLLFIWCIHWILREKYKNGMKHWVLLIIDNYLKTATKIHAMIFFLYIIILGKKFKI